MWTGKNDAPLETKAERLKRLKELAESLTHLPAQPTPLPEDERCAPFD